MWGSGQDVVGMIGPAEDAALTCAGRSAVHLGLKLGITTVPDRMISCVGPW
jgi:hypothetical protein